MSPDTRFCSLTQPDSLLNSLTMSEVAGITELDLKLASAAELTQSTPEKAPLGTVKLDGEEEGVEAPFPAVTENGGVSELEVETPIPISQQPVSETQVVSSSSSKRGRRKKGEHDEHEEFLPVEQNPDWLPQNWKVKQRTRLDGKSKDKYYIEAETQRQFRSKREVLEYIKTGVRRSHKKMKTGEGISNATPLTTTQPESKWDTPPEKLTWVLASGYRWAAFIGEEPVPERKVAEWEAYYNGYHS